jgi:hypothetical protein
MHRLVIVSGPNRGSAFNLVEGENHIGRQMDNHIVLSSSKVSKKHCSISVNSSEIFLRDETSTNGTFVNGALTKQQTLRSGDKLGVGEFVLEVVKARVAEVSLPDAGGMGSLAVTGNTSSGIMMPSALGMPSGMASGRVTIANSSFETQQNTVEEPDDLPSKLKVLFEGKIMPFFYSMLMKSEYSSVAGTVMAVAGLIAIVGAVMPMQDLAEKSITQEARIRTKVLAREVADRFQIHFANHTESQIDFSFLENEDSIHSVVITNPSLQIIAPVSRMNQMFAGSFEAKFATLMAKQFREGRETGDGWVDADRNLAVWVEPIKVADPRQVKSQLVALAIVGVDFSRNMISSGGLGVSYATSLVIGGLALIFAYLVLMRISNKPYEVLNEDLDQILRGEISKVTQEFKMEDTQGLWDNINTAAQRMPRGAVENQIDDGPINWEQKFEGFRTLADHGKFAFAGFDQNLLFASINDLFIEVSGIRNDSIGQAVSVVGDQSISALIVDLMKMAMQSQSKTTTDRFSFGGDDYDVVAMAVPVKDQTGLAVLFKRKG